MPLKETKLFVTRLYLIPKRDNTKPGNQFLEIMSQESAIYTLEQDDEHQVLPTLQEKCRHFQTAVTLSVSLAIEQNLHDVYCSF